MIQRKWLLPGTCAALFTIFLILNFYQSDFRIVVQRTGSHAPDTCVPYATTTTNSSLSSDSSSNNSSSSSHGGGSSSGRHKTSLTGGSIHNADDPMAFPEEDELPPLVPDEPVEVDPVPVTDEYGTTSFPVGTILDRDTREIKTKDGSHSLRLEDNGNVILYHHLIDTSREQNQTQMLWSLGTGAVEKEYEYTARLSETGVLSVLALLRHADGHFNEQLLWHSELLPGCMVPKKDDPINSAVLPTLDITSNGEVSISGRCVMFTPTPETIGRLAALVSGLYRSNAQVCKSQVEYLIAYPGATSVDFFVYALYEPQDIHGDVTVESIEKSIRECYGVYLRTLTLKAVEEVSEDYSGGEVARCGGKINRLQSQLKTLYNGGKQWLDWSAAQGVRHHTVLRIRTDHEFFGKAMPILKPASQLKGNELVMQPIAGGWPVPLMSHWFCSSPYGGIEVAVSDQIAYGRPSAMHFYLTMYKDFTRIVDMAVKEDNKAKQESYLCLTMPSGTEQKQCDRIEYCTIECALSWYLRIWDLELQVNWDWPIRIVRT